jgi:hypothetical protein
MNYDPTIGPRRVFDRRARPTSPLDALFSPGRRKGPRRDDEKIGAYFVDRFDSLTFLMVVALLLLTILDGILTIELIGLNSEEINPVMVRLLERGHNSFLIGKYVLTAAGLPFIVLYKHYPMFGSRFRVGYLLPVFISMYLVLIGYQWTLLNAGDPRTADERAVLSRFFEGQSSAREPLPSSEPTRVPRAYKFPSWPNRGPGWPLTY